jgi:predicted TPR repeat methyltransferase
MPRTRAVDRIDYLVRLATGRRVIHVGFAGESRASVDELIGRPTWLHGRLADVASSLVGIDLDGAAVDRARAAGFDTHVADAGDRTALRKLALASADLVIAAEVIEHVERPGVFLDAMHELVRRDGLLAVTTPNAASILNPLAAMGRFELINPDHVAFYSWYTLSNMLDRHGWRVRRFTTYHFPFAEEAWTGSTTALAGRVLVRVQTAAARVWPYLDFGLIALSGPALDAGSP